MEPLPGGDALVRPERGELAGTPYDARQSYGDPQVVTPWPTQQPHRQGLLDSEHDVYCLYDEHDQLLYVGMTWYAKRRFINHASPKTGSPWWHLVRRYDVRIVPNREAATELEHTLIWSLGPICNQPNPKDLAEFGSGWSPLDPPSDEFMSWSGK